METVLVEITDQDAYRHLENLENMHLLKVIKKNLVPAEKLSQKYGGKLPSDVADKLQEYVAFGK